MTLTNRTISKIAFIDENNLVVNWMENIDTKRTFSIPENKLNGENINNVQLEQFLPQFGLFTVEIIFSEEITSRTVQLEDEKTLVFYDVPVLLTPNTIDYNVIEWTGENDPINSPGVGYTYDSAKNGFIAPSPDETYVLNEVTLEWEPDPEKLYDLHGDGKLYRYDSENLCWWPTW